MIIVSEERIAMIDRNDIQVQIDAETLKLTNVLFVSDLAINLISVSQLNSKKISVHFDAMNASTTFMFNEKIIDHANKIFNQFLLRNEIYSITIKNTDIETHAFSLIKKSMNIKIEHELKEFRISKNDMFLRKFYENVSERDEEFAYSDDYFTFQSNFNDENDSSNEAFDEASDEASDEMFDENENNAFDEAFDDNETFQDISQIAFKRRMTSSSSSFSDRATRSSRDEASRSDYAKLHDSRKRTRNSTRNSDDDSENSENIIENIIESIIESINYS